ncbi:MAG: hypothetical protein M5U12_31145 [Verrucomicrobia bacterium]|nr:hypothetical protein [Verrucomicrobiota bacterium]
MARAGRGPRRPEAAAGRDPSPRDHRPLPLEYIDTSFENASPLWYEPAPDGSILVHLLYDHERASPNRAAGHIHFRLHAPPGTRLILEFKNLDNVWNGQPGSVAPELQAVVVSEDGHRWQPQPTESLPGNRVRLSVTMPGPQLYVARVEPYRLSDLERLLTGAAPIRWSTSPALVNPSRDGRWICYASAAPTRPGVCSSAPAPIPGRRGATG